MSDENEVPEVPEVTQYRYVLAVRDPFVNGEDALAFSTWKDAANAGNLLPDHERRSLVVVRAAP